MFSKHLHIFFVNNKTSNVQTCIFKISIKHNDVGLCSTKRLYINGGMSVVQHSINNKRPMGQIAHRRKQFKSINTYNYIITLIRRRKNPSSWELNGSSFEHTLIPLHPRVLCVKFGWNWLSGSVGEDFYILSMYFRYFLVISSWKKVWLFIWANLNPLHPRMLYAKFGWNCHSGSGEVEF